MDSRTAMNVTTSSASTSIIVITGRRVTRRRSDVRLRCSPRASVARRLVLGFRQEEVDGHRRGEGEERRPQHAGRIRLASAMVVPPASRPPIAGPTAKPRPKAAEILPMAPARSSGVGDVGDVGIGRGEVGGRHAAHDAGQRQHPQRIGEAHHQVRSRVAQHADEQYRAAAAAVAHGAPQGHRGRTGRARATR